MAGGDDVLSRMILGALAAAACAGPLAAQERDLGGLALSLVNDARAEAGLPALEAARVLAEAAAAHAADMLERDYYGHVGPDGGQPRDRYLAAGGNPWRLVAENIARCEGCPTPPGAERVRSFQSGWMQSEGHRENILAPGLDRFGFGIAAAEGEVYTVQLFAGPGTAPGASDGAAAERADADTVRSGALDAVNAGRREAGRPPLEPSGELDALAEALASEVVVEGDALSLPSDPFALLPADATGWTGLSVAAEACGGCGAFPAAGDGAHFGPRLTSEGRDRSAEGFTHFGFALDADGSGRKIAVGVLGRR